jgi:hypothetical protein
MPEAIAMVGCGVFCRKLDIKYQISLARHVHVIARALKEAAVFYFIFSAAVDEEARPV